MKTETTKQRLRMRRRPEGAPLMEQTWNNLLFLHWAVDPAVLRPHIPEELDLDLFEGQAWIGVTPFSVDRLRLMLLPPIPGLDSFIELNVRTYVRHRKTPGVWFFSLDASKAIPVTGARVLYTLPYLKATMDFQEEDGEFRFESERSGPPPAFFRARWRVGEVLRDPDVESLAWFLVERYCLFSGNEDSLSMTRIYHAPWNLQEGWLGSLETNVISALGLPTPEDAPLVHFSRSLRVEIWPPQSI